MMLKKLKSFVMLKVDFRFGCWTTVIQTTAKTTLYISCENVLFMLWSEKYEMTTVTTNFWTCFLLPMTIVLESIWERSRRKTFMVFFNFWQKLTFLGIIWFHFFELLFTPLFTPLFQQFLQHLFLRFSLVFIFKREIQRCSHNSRCDLLVSILNNFLFCCNRKKNYFRSKKLSTF